MTFVGGKLAAFLARLRDGEFTAALAELQHGSHVCKLHRDLSGSTSMREASRARAKRALARAVAQAHAHVNAGEDR